MGDGKMDNAYPRKNSRRTIAQAFGVSEEEIFGKGVTQITELNNIQMKKIKGENYMHYKYKFEVNGQTVDISNCEISKLITIMLLNLYEKNKGNEKLFQKQ